MSGAWERGRSHALEHPQAVALSDVLQEELPPAEAGAVRVRVRFDGRFAAGAEARPAALRPGRPEADPAQDEVAGQAVYGLERGRFLCLSAPSLCGFKLAQGLTRDPHPDGLLLVVAEV